METVEFNRLRWQCRRGLLENDLVLERFLARHGEGLAGHRLEAFRTLLDLSDNDLWDVVSGRAECRDPSLDEVVALLRAC
jgi:antitoxin CptB